MNTYEVVFDKDIILADSIRPYGAQAEIRAVIQQFDIQPDADQTVSNAEYDRMESLQIPALSSRVYLEEKRNIKGTWYTRPNLGHYIGLDKDAHGVTLDYLVYADSSWRTLPAPNQIEIGMLVNLFHDGHATATYQVAEKQVMPLQGTFIASKTKQRQIILLLEDHKNNVYYGYSLVEKS
jgi:hypothetical protein